MAPSYPYVLGHEFTADGDVRVTFAVGYLKRATILVPWLVWLAGESVTVGRLATEFVAGLDPPYVADDAPADVNPHGDA